MCTNDHAIKALVASTEGLSVGTNPAASDNSCGCWSAGRAQAAFQKGVWQTTAFLRLWQVHTESLSNWHAHVQSADAKLLIVENRNTSRLNSPRAKITPEQRQELLDLTRLIWGNA